jgi:hypothetical protein
MDTLIHADIFFFITSVAVIAFTVIMVIVLIYVIIILKDIRYISRKVRDESDVILEDVHELRANVKAQGFAVGHFYTFFKKLFIKGRASRKSKQ